LSLSVYFFQVKAHIRYIRLEDFNIGSLSFLAAGHLRLSLPGLWGKEKFRMNRIRVSLRTQPDFRLIRKKAMTPAGFSPHSPLLLLTSILSFPNPNKIS